MTPEPTGTYDAAYHAALQAGSRRSAAVVLALLQDLFAPKSLVDFGCGSGDWLAEARARGIPDLLGVDGPWVRAETLEIDPALFDARDLSLPLDLGRRFDLALCLEVAEHLPAAAAPGLVDTLCAHAPVVAFSAAIPGQGGEGHVNEAWPAYWRDLFTARGHACFDAIRPQIWSEAEVEPWYRQNLLIFAARDHLARDPALRARLEQGSTGPLDLVHPAIFESYCTLVTEMGERLGASMAQVEQLEAERAAQAAQIDAQAARLNALRNSLSWRITAPLRKISRYLRR